VADIDAINVQLEKEGAKWRAKESSISKLTPEQFRRRLGWIKPSLPPRAHSGGPPPNWSPGDPSDESVDWRARNGKNYVTPVKDQGGCGTCVAFAVTSLVESMALIESDVTLDLSEADLAFCGSHAANCAGWYQDSALEDVMSRGIVTSAQFSYPSAFPNSTPSGGTPVCKVIANHDVYAVKVLSFQNVYSVADRKSYLTNVGPMVTGFTCYSDFASYGSGIYSPMSTADVVGGHVFLIIGYSDLDQCWIFKNSSGPTWGENGFGKMAYGVCDIDTETASDKTYSTGCNGVSIPPEVMAELISNKDIVTLGNVPQAFCCDGFYSDDDGMRHAVVGAASGQVVDISYSPKSGTKMTTLTIQPDLVDIGAFYTNDDNARHVIIATQDGSISEIFYKPEWGVHIASLGTVTGATRVCGFYTPDDNYRHAIVATAAGEVFEIFYGTQGIHRIKIGEFPQIGKFPPIIDIAGFYSPDDQYRHVIVGLEGDVITEIFYNPQTGIGMAPLGDFAGLSRLGAFFDANNNFYNRRVLTLWNAATESFLGEIRYSSPYGLVKNTFMEVDGAIDVGGFYSPDDDFAHGILSFGSFDIKEVFYRP